MEEVEIDAPPRLLSVVWKDQAQRADRSRDGECLSEEKPRDEVIQHFKTQQGLGLIDSIVMIDILEEAHVPLAYDPCYTPLSKLTKTKIKKLCIESHHRGRYVLLRSVTPPQKINIALMTIVEDEKGNVLMLRLYFQDEKRDKDEILREGTVLIVKEPYLRPMCNGRYGIRVDHVSDVIFLSKHDERVPKCWQQTHEEPLSAVYWRVKGVNHLYSSEYYTAIDGLTMGLRCDPSDEETARLRYNRALAFYKTGQFDAALSDTTGPTIPDLIQKVELLKAQALYSLERYGDSCDTLTELGRQYPRNPKTQEAFRRAIARLRETRHGIYPFKEMDTQAVLLPVPQLDFATYIGPVEIRPSKIRGRGTFTTKAVKVGDLLLCEKAFATTLTVLTGKRVCNSLTSVVVQKLYRNPSLLPVFSDLHRGGYRFHKPVIVDGAPVVDTFLVGNIIDINGFAAAPSARNDFLRDEVPMGPTQETHSIWIKASYINHSCCGNAHHAIIGDMIIIRAIQDIPADTEITICYLTPTSDDDGGEQRRKDLQAWGFICDCAMCQDDKATDKEMVAERKRLKPEIKQCFGHVPDVSRAETLLDRMAGTYNQRACDVSRLSPWPGYMALTKCYLMQHQLPKAIESALAGLESLGYVIEGARLPSLPETRLVVKKWGLLFSELIQCWMILATAYHTAAPLLSPQAISYARITHKICLGEDETFEKTRMDLFWSNPHLYGHWFR